MKKKKREGEEEKRRFRTFYPCFTSILEQFKRASDVNKYWVPVTWNEIPCIVFSLGVKGGSNDMVVAHMEFHGQS